MAVAPLVGIAHPTFWRLPEERHRPDGIIAALLAVTIAASIGVGVRLYARRLAERRLAAVTTVDVPLKYQTLTLQRAGLASGHTLPIYGSSELFCCGDPHRPTQLFGNRPTGFDVLALGRAGTGDLFFMQTFAALGRALDGKKLVISDSPAWFEDRHGIGRGAYADTFLPEVAYGFVFDAPISRHLREAGARRMLAYPEALRDDPLLGKAVEDLAHPTPMRVAEYAALVPLGRVATWVLQVRDALRTTVFLREHASARLAPRPRPAPVGWVRLATIGTGIAERQDTTNPFGFSDATYRVLRRRPRFRTSLELYQSGRTNRDGDVLPAPTAWESDTERSAEWIDLRLALRVLREMGAHPLVWSLPLPGAYFDYTPFSAPARRTYYDRYRRTAERLHVRWLDFRAHEEDPWFLTDPGSHLSARGWVFADRALDLFWHGRSIDDIRAALVGLSRRVRPPTPPRVASAAGSEEGR